MQAQSPLFSEAASPYQSFEKDAYGFLLGFVKGRRGRSFSAEDVSLAALAAKIAPSDLRAWGRLFVQAEREGHIRRSDEMFRRSMGNGTWARGWIAV